MVKLLLKLGLFLPILVGMAVFNYWVDPANLFHGDAFTRGIARLLLEGRNVANLTDYDERLVQKEYIQGLRSPREVIVLGSSRAMQISSAFFPERSFFNHAMSMAVLEDEIAIYTLYLDQGYTPAMVVLVLDAWILNGQHGRDSWLSLEAEYSRGAQKMGFSLPQPQSPVERRLETILELLSPAYFQASLKNFLKGGEQFAYYPTEETTAEVNIKLSDGSISYNAAYRLASPQAVEQKVASARQNQVYALENFTRLDAQYQQLFEAFVRSMRENDTQVVLVLAPYHPEFYDYLAASPKYHLIKDAQAYFYAFAQQNQIPILGSYDGEAIPCGKEEFYDQFHPKPECMRRVMDALVP